MLAICKLSISYRVRFYIIAGNPIEKRFDERLNQQWKR